MQRFARGSAWLMGLVVLGACSTSGASDTGASDASSGASESSASEAGSDAESGEAEAASEDSASGSSSANPSSDETVAAASSSDEDAEEGSESAVDSEAEEGSEGAEDSETAETSDTDGPTCEDSCPLANGVSALCKQRFMFGLNYAWHNFGGDFGGIAAWSQPGVSENRDAIRAELLTMKEQAGANVIRWWMFADFRGDGIALDDAGMPTGLGGTAVADLQAALELAEEVDVYLMLTLFSFDTFRSRLDGEALPSLQPIIIDDAGRAALMENAVRPVARTVAESPHARRMIAWDVINEPEWAIEGPSPYGDEDYDPNRDAELSLLLVSHEQMETFLADTIAVLRDESDALVSVGATAFKWAHAWQNLDTDFHQFHMYDWIDNYWPHDQSPETFDLGDKPVVMGEFPLGGLSRADLPTMLDNWWNQGYAGALGWAFSDENFRTEESLGQMKAFADAHSCEVAY